MGSVRIFLPHSQNFLRFGSCLAVVETLCVESEEVVVEASGYPQQKVGVDGLLGENVVYVGALAVDLACEPCRCAFLAQHLFPYFTADVQHKLS